MSKNKNICRLPLYLLPLLFIIFSNSCATHIPVLPPAADTNVKETAVSTLIPSPSHTPLPILPLPTPTPTTEPTQTHIPLPLASMTPFSTVTPDYTVQEPKSIFLLFGELGGDGGLPIGHYAPSLVIYTDGQLIYMSRERHSRIYLETYLLPSEMCRLKQEIEATGFLEPHEFDEYYTQTEGSEGASNVVIQLEDTFYSFYSPDIQYLKEDLHAGYEIIANYQPPESLKLYTPTYLALLIDQLEPDDGSIPITWPTNLPPITELQLNPEEHVILIEEGLVESILDLFMYQQTSGYFQDGKNIYFIFPYSLLPHETLRQFSNYPDIPLDYVSLLNCNGEASFISPAIPTTTLTLTSSAAQLTGKGRVLFVTDADGDTEIYVMEADGTNRLRLTNNISDDWSPTWSPNGQFVAFVSDRDGDSEIYSIYGFSLDEKGPFKDTFQNLT
ncbi:MAG: PD40 domain-containing protein [Ardenticatenaceae bacterium]|nr:PD40 domain-containing protein [Ardenticatenaceae bacterium]